MTALLWTAVTIAAVILYATFGGPIILAAAVYCGLMVLYYPAIER